MYVCMKLRGWPAHSTFIIMLVFTTFYVFDSTNFFFSLFKHMEYVKLKCTQRKNRITQFPSYTPFTPKFKHV